MQVLYGMAKTTFLQQDFEQVSTGASKINVHLETES